MNIKTFIVYLCMYLYGFSLTLWALFFDKRPTKKTLMAAKWGLGGLILTLFYFFYVLWKGGLQ